MMVQQEKERAAAVGRTLVYSDAVVGGCLAWLANWVGDGKSWTWQIKAIVALLQRHRCYCG